LSSLLPSCFKSSTYTSSDLFSSLGTHNQLLSAHVLMEYVLYSSNGETECPWNIPLRIRMGGNCISSRCAFNWSAAFRISIDNMQYVTILQFTPTSSSTDFSAQLRQTPLLLLLLSSSSSSSSLLFC
jgi:hypothetical protein